MEETITATGLELRRWCQSDRDALAEIVASSLEHISRYMPQAAFELADPSAFLTRASELWDCGEVLAYAIVRSGRVVGHITLTPHDTTAVVGYWVRVEAVGHGYATTALRTLADAIFATTEIAQLHADCNAANIASARVLTKAGFRLVGRRPWTPRTDVEAPEELLWCLGST